MLWVRDPALLQSGCMSQLWLKFNPYASGAAEKRRKKRISIKRETVPFDDRLVVVTRERITRSSRRKVSLRKKTVLPFLQGGSLHCSS